MRQRISLFVSLAVIVVIWWLTASEGFKALSYGVPPLNFYQFFGVSALSGLFLFLVVWAMLAWRGLGFTGVGFHKKEFWKQLGRGALWGLLLFAFYLVILLPLCSKLLPAEALLNSRPYFAKPIYLLPWLVLAVLKGGFQEELWRIFCYHTFESLLGKFGLTAAVVLNAFFFGLAHSYEGMASACAMGVLGLLWGLIYLRKRNAWEVVAAHGVFELIIVGVGFMNYA